VLFIESVDGSKFNDVFLAQLRPKGNARPSVVVADSGQLAQRKDGSQIVTLNKGTRFEGTAMLRDFRITDFQNYQAIIGHQAVALDPTDTEQMDMRTLWNTDTDRARAEFHWRITLIHRVYDGADCRSAERGEPASGPRALYAAGDAALPDLFPAANLDSF
jgi:lipopolysaccharide export system permease protein